MIDLGLGAWQGINAIMINSYRTQERKDEFAIEANTSITHEYPGDRAEYPR